MMFFFIRRSTLVIGARGGSRQTAHQPCKIMTDVSYHTSRRIVTIKVSYLFIIQLYSNHSALCSVCDC